MSGEERNPWTVLETRAIYDNPWISLVEHKVLTPRRTPGIYGVISMKSLATGVVAFTPEGKIILVGQYRFPLEKFSWEIPEGGGDPALPPQVSAARELKEETGYEAENWLELLRLDLSNSVTDERAVTFLAWNLRAGEAAPEETEELSLRHVTFVEALGMVMRGEITDAISVACLLKVKVLFDQGALPEAVRPYIGI